MEPFEQMTREEQLKHLTVDHDIQDAEQWFTGAPSDVEAHQQDHDEWLDDHEHDHAEG
jgi:hypothetical protein